MKHKSTLYKFTINITDASLCMSETLFAKKIPNGGFMNIQSNAFDKFRECEKAMTKLLNKLGIGEIDGGEKPVIVMKTNPNLADENDLDEITDGWEDNIVLKAFLINAGDIRNKTKNLKYSVSGTIEYSIVNR